MERQGACLQLRLTRGGLNDLRRIRRLTEHTVRDEHTGRIVTPDLVEYHVPVHADIPDIEVIQVPEQDLNMNELGVKGIGEIGMSGTAAAIANAVFHATGKRIRELPITLDKLM